MRDFAYSTWPLPKEVLPEPDDCAHAVLVHSTTAAAIKIALIFDSIVWGHPVHRARTRMNTESALYVYWLVALPPCGTCWFTPKICSNAPKICSIAPIAQPSGPGSRGTAGISPIKLGQNGLPRVTLKSAPGFPAFVGPDVGTLQNAPQPPKAQASRRDPAVMFWLADSAQGPGESSWQRRTNLWRK